ncbi:VLRF1 family aeRF1-type release factor [Aquibacillus kalidii]|uniref:VLRF1 family aeRF1-type release factor n=1 Tax=Aquibacillus kalidii TaxID=2762597 RepID=UPI00164494E5|nr:VLRF1 family aeRF1-type release factor [Aquibacillus kalidii]
MDKPNSVLSIYLNTNPANQDSQAGGWKIQLKNGLNSFENYLKQSNDVKELKNFKKVRDKVETYINKNKLNFKKSLVIFASTDGSVWFTKHLEMDVKTELFWQENVVTDQLYQLHLRFPRTGIMLLQQNQAKIIDAELRTILDTNFLVYDQESDDWVEVTENNQSDGQADSEIVTEKTRVYKRLAEKLDDIIVGSNWENIIVVGEKEEVHEITQQMDQHVDRIEHLNLLDHKEAKIIEKLVA